MAVRRNSKPADQNYSTNSNSNLGNSDSGRKRPKCSHCGNDRHYTDTYWKKNGYPSWHRLHKFGGNRSNTRMNRTSFFASTANAAQPLPSVEEIRAALANLTNAQCQHMLSAMKETDTNHEQHFLPQANIASSFLSVPAVLPITSDSEFLMPPPPLNSVVFSDQSGTVVESPSTDQVLSNFHPSPSSNISPTSLTLDVGPVTSASPTLSPIHVVEPELSPQNTSSLSDAPLRQSQRPKLPNVRLKDYICSHVTLLTNPSSSSLSGSHKGTRYPLCNFISYHRYSPSYLSFIANVSHHVEPSCFADAVFDPNGSRPCTLS
ncbi:hypothetical protein LWI29_001825 [Acer saccharum]|uniref:Uncharacterized protein n=1 Tax=Acer saccharum TaxID=4024 RepID=A0AA39VMU4_ACESA|nr:hypothetical protein LWI29_001825 [Acer saccharum]